MKEIVNQTGKNLQMATQIEMFQTSVCVCVHNTFLQFLFDDFYMVALKQERVPH